MKTRRHADRVNAGTRQQAHLVPCTPFLAAKVLPILFAEYERVHWVY
ncbi:hypothetical protein [Streptosporangium sp. NPDC006930]